MYLLHSYIVFVYKEYIFFRVKLVITLVTMDISNCKKKTDHITKVVFFMAQFIGKSSNLFPNISSPSYTVIKKILYTAYNSNIIFWTICKRFHGLSNNDDYEERETKCSYTNDLYDSSTDNVCDYHASPNYLTHDTSCIFLRCANQPQY